jgi:hypothetical protein
VLVMADQDLTGPRGSVYAFSRAAANGQARRVPVPAARVRREIDQAYRHFAAAAERVYGNDPMGGAVKVGHP